MHRTARPFVALLALLALALPAAATDTTAECEVIDFNELIHGDHVLSLSALGGSLSLSLDALRNAPAGIVPPTAYDTEFYDAGKPPPNATHEDTQRAFRCNNAANGGNGECDGIVLMVPDTRFFVEADDTEGGFITLSGFNGDFEIASYAALDSDDTSQEIILRVGPGLVEVGRSSGLGDGSVETVITDPHIFTDSAQFELEGSGAIDNVEVCRIPAPFCGDGHIDASEECDDGNNMDGDGCSADCLVERQGGQGCTPGYWKQPHHLDSWAGFDPNDDFESVFGVDANFSAETLLDALRQGGGKEKALGRHATAAILNAANSNVSYFETVAEIISRVQEAYATGDFNGVKDLLDQENNEGCPLN